MKSKDIQAGRVHVEVTERMATAARTAAEAREAARQANDAQAARMMALHARLAAHGVRCGLAARHTSIWTDTEYDRRNSPPNSFRMSEADAAHLADLLDAITGKADNAAQEA